MCCFVTSAPDDLVEECRSEMLHDNMELSCFMVHVQQVEESRHNRKNMDVKSARPYDGGTSKGFEIKDK